MNVVHRFNEWRKEEVYVPLPFARGTLSNQTPCVLEVTPSLSHENKEMETLLHSFHMMFDTGKLRMKRQEAIGLEIYADRDRVSYHFSSPEDVGELLSQRIQQSFSGSGIHRLGSSVDPATRFSEDDYALTLDLKEPNFLPIHMQKDGKVFHLIAHSLAHLKESEKVFLQILMQPIDDSWQEEFKKQYKSWLEGEDVFHKFNAKQLAQTAIKGAVHSVERLARMAFQESQGSEERRKAVANVAYKLAQPGFKTHIRILIQSENPEPIGRAITAGFRTLGRQNDFIAKKVWMKKSFLGNIKERKMSLTEGFVLCIGELASLVKLPDKTLEMEKIQRMTPEDKEIPESLTQSGIYIGDAVSDGKKKPVNLSIKHKDDIARIKLFIAAPGSGKSTLVEQLVYEYKRLGHGSAVFDIADGRLAERIIAMLPEFKEDIVVVDYTNELYPPALNLSSLGGDDDTRGLMFGEFFEVFFTTQDLARTQSYMLKAAMSVFSDDRSTLLEFILMLRDEEYRNVVLPSLKIKNPDLYLWWKREFPKISEARLREIVAPIMVRLDHFLYNFKMRNILCQRDGVMNPMEWMDDGKIVVFNLSNGTFTESEQRILMSLHNYMFWNATLAREKYTKNNIEPRPFHLWYDEPQSYIGATPMFSRAVSKARKYRVSLNFFIQDAEQIIKENSALWKEFMGMNPHIFVGPVSESTARAIAKPIGMEVEDILSIAKKQYHWILRTYHNKEALPAVVFKAALPRDHEDRKEVTDMSHVKEVKEISTLIYSKMDKESLRQDISARNMGLSLEDYQALLNESDSEEIVWEDCDGKNS